MEHLQWLLPAVSTVLPIGAVIGLGVAVIKNNKENDTKVSRVYRRLDETKEVHDEKFVNKDVCEILHKHLRDDVSEIKQDVKLLLRKNGIK